MTKPMVFGKLVVMLALTGFKFPTSAAQYWVTNSYSLPCIARLRGGVCGIPPDYRPCCHAILMETQSDRDCMCYALNIDPAFKNDFKIHCDTFSDTLKLCTSGPLDFATSGPGVNLPLFPPANQSSGTKNKTMKTIGGVVGSVVFMVLVVLSGIAFSKCYLYFQCCICCNSYTR